MPGSELGNLCLLNGILNKITGPAASIINSNGIPDNWLEIRNTLINNFADQRDETALYNDLSLATQGQRTPQEFYDHCQNLFSTIMTYVSLHEPLASTIDAKRALYRKTAMKSFVRGLQEPLGSRIRCMRPDSLEKAFQYVQEELNVMYLQNRNDFVRKPQQVPRAIQLVPVHNSKPLQFQPPTALWPTPAMQKHLPSAPQPFRFAPQSPQQQGFRPNPMQGQYQPQVILRQTITATCNFSTVHLLKEAMERLDDRSYSITFPQATKVQLKCGTEDYNMLNGSFLATLPLHCSLQTPEFTIANTNDALQGHPLKIMKIDYPAGVKSAKSLQLHLSSIDLKTLHNIQEITSLQHPVQLKTIPETSYYHTTIPFYVVLFSAAVLIVIQLFRRQTSLKLKSNSTEENSVDQENGNPENLKDHIYGKPSQSAIFSLKIGK